MKKFLLIAPNWVGDAVMSLPLVGLLGSVPGGRLTVCAPEYVARIYLGLEEVAELIVIERWGRLRRIAATARLLHQLKPDGAVILPPSFSSALTLVLAGVPVRIGYAFDGRARLLTTSLASHGFKDDHLSNRYLELGRALLGRLRLPVPNGDYRPAMHICESDRRSVEEVVRGVVGSSARFAVVVPGATYGPAKTWPKRHYRRLLELLSPRIPVVLAGSGVQRVLCDELALGLAHVYNYAGRTTLGEFAALLAAARVVVANDSGAPHIAGSVGTPVIVLFGSTSPRWTAPSGPQIDIISGSAPCSPCFLEECPTELECFNSITPELVMDRVDRLLEKKSR